jgi:nitrile hydratase
MHGFGRIPIQEEDYVFRYNWQRRSFGLAQALAGATPFCADMHRFKIEQISAIDYLQMDYFEKWAIATSELLKDAGLVDAGELATGQKQFDVDLVRHPPASPKGLIEAMSRGMQMHYPTSTLRPDFSVGDLVRVSINAPTGHTRAPRYTRGKQCEIVADNGVFQFADTIAAGEGPNPQYYYTVRFTARSLWGESAEAGDDKIYMDLAEAYLERA